MLSAICYKAGQHPSPQHAMRRKRVAQHMAGILQHKIIKLAIYENNLFRRTR